MFSKPSPKLSRRWPVTNIRFFLLSIKSNFEFPVNVNKGAIPYRKGEKMDVFIETSLAESLNLVDSSSQKSLISFEFFSASLCIFKPCSSVPVKKNTLKPSILLNLAKISATILE